MTAAALPWWRLMALAAFSRRVEKELKALNDALDSTLARLPRVDPHELEQEVSARAHFDDSGRWEL